MDLDKINQEMENFIQTKTQDIEEFKRKIAIMKEQLVEKQKLAEKQTLAKQQKLVEKQKLAEKQKLLEQAKQIENKVKEEIFEKLNRWNILASKISKLTGLDCSQPHLLEKALKSLKDQTVTQTENQFNNSVKQVVEHTKIFSEAYFMQKRFIDENQLEAIQHCKNQLKKFQMMLDNISRKKSDMPKDNEEVKNLEQFVELYKQNLDKLEDDYRNCIAWTIEKGAVDKEQHSSLIDKEQMDKLKSENKKMREEKDEWCTKASFAFNFYLKEKLSKTS